MLKGGIKYCKGTIDKRAILWVLLLSVHILLMYQLAFKIDIENTRQLIILIISPLSTLILSTVLLPLIKKEKNKITYILIVTIVLNLVLYANKVFYTFFNDFITIPLLFQTSNFSDLGSSSTSSLIGWDIIIYFLPSILVLIYKLRNKSEKEYKRNYKRAISIGIMTIMVGAINLILSETERPELLTRSFDREIIVKNINLYNYHAFDLITQVNIRHNRASASSDEYMSMINKIKSNKVSTNKGKLDKVALVEGDKVKKNILLVNLESLQQYMLYQKGINKETGKEEYVLPNLRKLMLDKDTLYFDNFYPQIGQGKTSDSEFIIDTGLYPLDRGAVFFTNGDNKYSTLTQGMNAKGYYSTVYHANDSTFWNRNMMYKSLGVNKFHDVDSYKVRDEDSVNWGLKDKEYIKQTVKLIKGDIKESKKPVYGKLITLTNHYPFTLEEKDASLNKYTTGSKTLNNYVQTARYLDESIGLLFKELKEQGLYEDTIIILYGDHRGISPNHDKGLSELFKRGLNISDGYKNERTPYYIHIPGSNINKEGKIRKELVSEQDIRPMISKMVGIDMSNEVIFGEDVLDKDGDSKPYVMLRDGRMVIQLGGKMYYKSSKDGGIVNDLGEGVTDKGLIKEIDNYYEVGKEELKMNDAIITKDLLRFKAK